MMIVTPANSKDHHHPDWFTQVLSGLSKWEHFEKEKNRIPTYNPSNHYESGQLVRVRGMVQDMWNAEYFCANDAILPPGLAVPTTTSLQERTPLVITEIPYATSWYRLEEEEEPSLKKVRLQQQEEEQQQTTCVVAKFYYDEQQQRRRLKLNELVELVGVMELPGGDDNDEPMMVDGSFWDEDEDPLPGAPRLHVVWFQTIQLDGDDGAPWPTTTSVDQQPAPMTVLSNALSLCEPNARALWLALLSMAERQQLEDSTTWAPLRTPSDTVLGCLSLNMVLPSPEACSVFHSRLVKVLDRIVPSFVALDISNEALLEYGTPKKVNGRLQQCPLQLPKGSTILLNLGAMQPGQLRQAQVGSLQALQQLTSSHSVVYEFDGGVRISFEADARIIVLSCPASRKLLPCTLQVQCDEVGLATDADGEMSSSLCSVRNALAWARSSLDGKHNNIGLSTDLLEQAQKDFIQRRAQARESGKPVVSEADFHRWLTLTRLEARSRKAEAATIEDWNRALALDDALKAH